MLKMGNKYYKNAFMSKFVAKNKRNIFSMVIFSFVLILAFIFCLYFYIYLFIYSVYTCLALIIKIIF